MAASSIQFYCVSVVHDVCSERIHGCLSTTERLSWSSFGRHGQTILCSQITRAPPNVRYADIQFMAELVLIMISPTRQSQGLCVSIRLTPGTTGSGIFRGSQVLVSRDYFGG